MAAARNVPSHNWEIHRSKLEANSDTEFRETTKQEKTRLGNFANEEGAILARNFCVVWIEIEGCLGYVLKSNNVGLVELDVYVF